MTSDRHSRRRLYLALLGILSASPSETAAQERPLMSLLYETPATSSCPTEQGFRDIVASRLGYDPFVVDVSESVLARITEKRGGFVGLVRVAESGSVIGERDLSTPQRDCGELAVSMALAISIVIDPFGELANSAGTAAPESSESSTPDMEALDETEAETETADVAPSARFVVSAGVGAELGLAPGIGVGPLVGLGLRVGPVSLVMEGQLSATPGTYTADFGDRIDATVYLAGPAACLHGGIALGCLGAQFGVLRGRGVDVVDASLRSAFLASLSIRGGLELPLTAALSFRGLIELRVPLLRTSFLIEETPVWEAPPASGALRFELALTIP